MTSAAPEVSFSGGTFRFPPVPYLPGRTERPAEDAFDPLKAGVEPGMSPDALAATDAFRGGHIAFAARYYWEAHELWEPVWMVLPPASRERRLMRGLIQLANAGLKARLGQPRAAARILAVARSDLAESLTTAEAAMGLTRADLAALEAKAMAERPEDA